MANDNEARALGAALAAPAFVTRSHGMALHTANRHVERWAPETTAGRVRSMRSLGFVDRLVAPWMETAQRSASLRLFTQYAHGGPDERSGGAVSWVFPRPWYQDELDWMAAARQVQARPAEVAPRLLTTRGTYVAPEASTPSEIAAPPMVMPSALYEYVAPSLSIASAPPAVAGVGFGGEAASREAYSPLIPLAAVQAAELMSRAVAPLAGQAGSASSMTPQLRSVLSSILARAATPRAGELPATRHALSAPHLETPPAPTLGRADERFEGHGDGAATQVAERYAEQRARVVELQRLAQQAAQRELAAREAAIAEAARAAVARAQVAAPTAATSEPRGADAARPASPSSQAASPELRAAAERAEQELRQRAGDAHAAELQRQTEAAGADAAERARVADAAERARVADAAERARVEERIAQRIAERTAGQRLHEQARAAAAADVRAAGEARRAEVVAMPVAPVEQRVPAAVTAAVADLPPELAAILGPAVARQPGRALEVIHELNETLRTVELLARSSAVGGAFEPTRGPRLMMPAGLGGLVSAVDRAHAFTQHPATSGGRALAPLRPIVEPQLVEPGIDPRALSASAAAQRAIARDVRVPTLPWLTAGAAGGAAAGSAAPAPTTALGATAMTTPAALSHVAWADRWLARFAGATPQSLDVMSASAASPALRMQALASAAPEVVFVAPEMLRGDLSADPARRASSSIAALTAAGPTERPMPRLINPTPSEPVRRFDDEAETPDDVFAAIAAAASRGRAAPRAGAEPSIAASSAAAPAPAPQAAASRVTLADVVAHSAPSAPGAGMSAQLASSPFAPALRHVLALPSVPTFDVRSLFGSGLGATYLAGLLGASSHELEIGARAPTWASWSEAPLAYQLPGDRIDRLVPDFDAAYVRPESIGFDDADEAALAARVAAAPSAPSAPSPVPPVEDRATAPLPPTSVAPAGERGLPFTATADTLTGAAPATFAAAPTGATAAQLAASELAATASLTTLRSALLSWDVVATGEPGARDDAALQLVPGSFAAAPGAGSAGTAAAHAEAARSFSTARMMVDALSMPMLGDAAPDPTAHWAAPGMMATRAHAWSVAQERSAADLALDFVAPELVLAARVYGLGPAEAAQAARLSIVGPGQLGAMASTVDRTFVEALAIGRDAREARIDAERRVRSAPIGDAVAPASAASAARAAAASAAPTPGAVAITTAFPTPQGDIAAAIAPTGVSFAAQPPSTLAFGVDRRVPRGAFLWPPATVAALGMNAAGSDGQMSISVAALELLAARAVAELGTYTVLSEADGAGIGSELAARTADRGVPSVTGAAASLAAPGAAPGAVTGAAPADRTSPSALPVVSPDVIGRAPGAAALAALRSRDAGLPGHAEPGEADVLGAAAAFVPASRRARFEALYVALSQSGAGRQWSPAARAARALALAGRSDDAPISARERAATAWDVLPVVYASDSAIVGDGAALGVDAASDITAAFGAGAAGAAEAAGLLSSFVAPSGPASVGAGSPAAARGAGSRTRRGAASRGGVVEVDAVEGEGFDAAHVTGPGLGRLSARAGEALGSYVTPVPPPAAPQAPERRSDPAGIGAVLRAPTAAPEYVHTGRSAGRYGGGEVEIPPWFEAAARRMLAEQSGSGDGISLAELTLVTSAPASQIAAARIQPSAASPQVAQSGAAAQTDAPKIDVERLANELYRDILVMMDIARARNGEPYL